MAELFPIVIVGVSLIAIVVAVAVSMSSGGVYERIGKGGLSMDGHEQRRGPKAGSPAARAEADDEIRQLVQAKSARRVARGQAPLDVDAEIAALTRPAPVAADAGLREEVRQLVVAKNARRVRQGKEPLDVDSEVERQLRDLGG